MKIYSIENCPYCDRARSLLKNEGIAFEEVKADSLSGDELKELLRRSGMRTFPQIFNGEGVIGGYTELRAAYERGELKA